MKNIEKRIILPYRVKEINEKFGGEFDSDNDEHILILSDIISTYDKALDTTVITGEVEDVYSINFQYLIDFALAYPNFEYQKFLMKKDSDQLSYFYSETIGFYEQKTGKDVTRILKHYENMR